MEPYSGSRPYQPSPLSVDRASRQLSIDGTLLHPADPRLQTTPQGGHRITLNFPAKGRAGAVRHKAVPKRKASTTIVPLRGSDAPGNKATINHVLARCEPRQIHHNKCSAWVEELLVQWEPEKCTPREARKQQRLGFDISSIINLDEAVPSPDLQPFITAKRLGREQSRKPIRLPITTNCMDHFAPSPQRPTHIRSIKSGTLA